MASELEKRLARAGISTRAETDHLLPGAIGIGSEVQVWQGETRGYAWGVVDSVCPDTGEVHIVGKNGVSLFANSLTDLEPYEN